MASRPGGVPGGGGVGGGGGSLKVKVVLLGEGRVGKTSLVLRYVENKFNDKHYQTLQVSLSSSIIMGYMSHSMCLSRLVVLFYQLYYYNVIHTYPGFLSPKEPQYQWQKN